MQSIKKNIAMIWNSLNGEMTQESLDKENQILQSILNSLAEGVIVADKNGEFKFFNPVAEKILGIGSKNIAPSDWTSVYGCFYPDEVTPYPFDQLPLAKAIKGEEVNNELLFIRNADRPEGIYIIVSASPLRDSEGLVSGGTVIFRDITENKKAEQALKLSRERLKAQFTEIPIPTYVWRHVDNDFILIDFNYAAVNFTQNNIKKLIGIKLSKMYADSPEIQADFIRCFNEKKSLTREIPYKYRTTGENKVLNVTYVFVPPDLIMIHTEDVTERGENEERIKKLSNAVEQTADSVVIVNIEGIIEYVNPAFEKTTGYSKQEVLGQTPRILQSRKHDKNFYKKLWETILNGKPFRGTIINKKKNGELYWGEQTITPMKDKTGNITNFVSVMKDITELREKQEQDFQLRIAREIQQRFLKAKVSVPGYDIAGASFSAVEANGDYFDLISMPDGCIWMVVGDVSGHGIGAALIMSETRAYLRAFIKKESDPGIILTLLNKELAADLDEYNYVTLILAKLDPHQKLLEYTGAGHIPSYLLNGSGEVDQIIKSKGVPLGFLPDQKYDKSDPIKLVPGNILVFLTDGITEAFGPKETEFGIERTLNTVHNNRQSSARQILTHLFQEVRSFSAKQSQEDDLTSIICKVSEDS